MSLSEFIAAVRTGGKWDYKHNRSLVAAAKNGYYSTSLLDEFGNWNFGVVARGFNLALDVALLGAGAYQSFFSKEADRNSNLRSAQVLLSKIRDSPIRSHVY